MRKRFTASQKACGWHTILKTYGSDTADKMIGRAEKLYDKYSGIYAGNKGTKKMHVLSAVAFGSIYLPLKEITGSERAVRMMEEAAKPASSAKHDKIQKLPAGLFIKVAGLITSIMFSEKAGFKRQWHSCTNSEKSYDLLTCPYMDVLKSMDCQEVCTAICIQDDYSFSNLKNGVIFERKKTLGRGDDRCDFCFRIPEHKN